jgi:hypothetical protein
MQTSPSSVSSSRDGSATILKQLTRVLERQLRSTWDGKGRLNAAKARAAISDLTERVLVNHHGGDTSTGDGSLVEYAQLAVEKIKRVTTRADAVAVVDLRGILARVSLVRWARARIAWQTW